MTPASRKERTLRSVTRVALVVAALALVAAAPSAATAPQPVRFELNGLITGPNSIQGTFVATGAVNDSGAWTETFRFSGRSIHIVKTLTGAAGTITIRVETVVVQTSPTTITFQGGNWIVVSGTGAYVDLRAVGTPAGGPGSYADLATGVVHLIHEGGAHFQ